ncbi:uncharacterized protein PSFLO_02821 [Pseudozyma flocculosa]|uniref:Uncharacterized protein n=1 Tax=Pseudozyma flocculosa TaxID=84751 RepID=A0A5C3EYR5_9BASI|nr:uncharacterized protein PSFLO_02821 [Pseudozyma flocculosa]
MSVTAPRFSGCTIFGTDTGTCCTTFPVTANITQGSVTCQTSSDRVKALQQCLTPLVSSGRDVAKSLKCTGSSSSGAAPAAGPTGSIAANRWTLVLVGASVALAVVSGAV